MCRACLYVSNERFGDMKLLWTSSSSPQQGQLSFSKVLQARKRNFDTFSIKTNQEHTAEGLQELSQMLPCLGWCRGWLHATIAVRSPGFCQSRATPALWTWRNASKTMPSSTSYTPRSFVINLLIDGLP